MAEIKYPIELDDNSTLRDNFVDDEDDVLAEDQNNQVKAIKALEAKVGIDSSAEPTSIDYMLAQAVATLSTVEGDLSTHTSATNPHAGSASTLELQGHTEASNPHTGSASTADLDNHANNSGVHFHDHDHSGSGAQGGEITFGSGTPTGVILEFAGSTPPAGFLLCDGSLVPKASYPDLWALIGNTYGTGDVDNFKLPDKRDRVGVGVSATKALGTTGGQDTINLAHTHTVDNHAHTVGAEAPGTNSAGSHGHSGTAVASGDRANYYTYNPDGYTEVHDNHAHSLSINANGSHSHTVNSHSHGGATGGASPATNSQLSATQDIKPKYQAFNYIIKT